MIVRIDNDGVALDFDVAGDGPAVLLIHGFPDTRRVWRHQVPALLDAGYQVIVPDLRGFGSSAKPSAVSAYHLSHHVSDMIALLNHVGQKDAHVVGHDWGSAVAWATASFSPSHVRSVVSMSVGHPKSFAAAGTAQREKSWYLLLFQFEGVSEQWLVMDDFVNLRNWGNHPDIDEVVQNFQQPASVTAALNIYRANAHPSSWIAPSDEWPPVCRPALGLWGSGDFALTEGQMQGSAQYVSGAWRYRRLQGAGHWLQIDAADEVNRLLLDFLSDIA